jgi:hypothetical protein
MNNELADEVVRLIAANAELKENNQSLHRVIENADTEALNKLEEALKENERLKRDVQAAMNIRREELETSNEEIRELKKQIQHLKSSRVKDIEDAWDACVKAIFENCGYNAFPTDYARINIQKSSYLKPFTAEVNNKL